MEEVVHPIEGYGTFTHCWKIIPGFDRYEINEMSQIRKRGTDVIMKPNKDYQVDLYAYTSEEEKKGTCCKVRTYVMSLLAFFPHIPRLETVDHIDGDHDNQYIGNLQFLTNSENSAKYAKNRSKPTGANKAVIQLTEDKEDDVVYHSINEAARATGAESRHISRSCKTGVRAGGFYWKFQEDPTQKDLPGEIWKNTLAVQKVLGKRHREYMEDTLQQIQVSNLGRVKGKARKITWGTKERKDSHYRLFSSVRVHQLVWAAFGDPQPEQGQVICHDDKIPLDSEGCASNAIAHLSLGTYSDNTKMSYEHGKLSRSSRQRQVILATPHEEYGPRMQFPSQMEASRVLGLDRRTLYLALNKGKIINGYKWERVDVIDPSPQI
jgi:hypothetical protein